MNYKDRATYIVEACVADRDLAMKLLIRIASNNPFAVVRAHEASAGQVTLRQSDTAVATQYGNVVTLKKEEVFTPLQQRCVSLIRKGRYIDALKLYRNKAQCSIYMAKSEIDRLKQVINIG